jgi:trypsin-like peptidase
VLQPEVVKRLYSSTCAVLHMPIRHEEALASAVPDTKISLPETKVVGTGFLVRPDLVLTNRHIVKLIAADHKNIGHHDHWYLRFTYPASTGGISEATRRVTNLFAWLDLANVGGLGRLDIGFLQFNRDDNSDFQQCIPVEFDELTAIRVGGDVAICGFPLGNALLRLATGLQRFGPLIHHGIISGVAPFDVKNSRDITTFLTDVNSAGGMSGSPVFLPENGKVIGVHFAGGEGTFGCAVPVDVQRVDSWIRFFQRSLPEGKGAGVISVSPGGDILEESVAAPKT